MITFSKTNGMNNPNRKLSQQAVDHLRASYARKPPEMLQRDFCDDWAALFGVTRTCIQQVVTGINWREHRI